MEETPSRADLPERLNNDYSRAVLDYYEAYNKATETGETESFLRLAVDDCQSCRMAADKIDKVLDAGGRVEGGLEPMLDDPENTSNQLDENQASVSIKYRYDSLKIYSSDGGQPETAEVDVYDEQVNLVREGDEWLVKEITSVPVDKQ